MQRRRMKVTFLILFLAMEAVFLVWQFLKEEESRLHNGYCITVDQNSLYCQKPLEVE
jgi:regulatory protein YycI of two-component signal transduction system YycFG